jgi:hypothetical protein
LALAVLLVVIAFWDRPSPLQGGTAAMPVAQEQPQLPKLTEQQRHAADAQCRTKAGEEFRRAWNDGAVRTGDGLETAEFANYYNEKFDACFYELTVVRRTPAEGGDAVLLRKMLFDVNEGELYGEYRGPESGGSPGAGMPEVCRVAGLYCGSRREWDRLVEPFMETRAGAERTLPQARADTASTE